MHCFAVSVWAVMRQNVTAGGLCRKAAAPLLAEFGARPGAARWAVRVSPMVFCSRFALGNSNSSYGFIRAPASITMVTGAPPVLPWTPVLHHIKLCIQRVANGQHRQG